MSERQARHPGAERATARHAERPGQIPAAGWRAVARRAWAGLKVHHVSLLAAGVAFKGLLALFPAIVAAITLWGLVASPQQVTRQLGRFTQALPDEAGALLEQQMSNVAARGAGALSTALALSVLLALWSASGGLQGLMEAVGVVYDEPDDRSPVAKRGTALLLTAGAILFVLVAMGLIAVLPAVLAAAGLAPVVRTLVQVGQWVLLALLAMGALAVLYRVGPDRARPRMRWVSWGAAAGTVLWLLGSALFTLYVNNFGSFGQTYGTLAGIIVLMLWLYLTAFVVLLGAEVNAEIERQAGRRPDVQ